MINLINKPIKDMTVSEYATVINNAKLSPYAKWMQNEASKFNHVKNLDKWELYLKYGKK